MRNIRGTSRQSFASAARKWEIPRMERMHFRPAEEFRASADVEVEAHRGRILAVVPGADVHEVGGTSIPGAWTKGDLDLVVSIEAAGFETAAKALSFLYQKHQTHNWTPTYASFKEGAGSSIPVGVQLVAAGAPEEDLFVPVRDLLASDPDLLEDYNRLKQTHEGALQDDYSREKAQFMEALVSRARDYSDAASPRVERGSE